MASRLFKLLFGLVALVVIFGVMVVVVAWMFVVRGPSVRNNSTLILRIGNLSYYIAAIETEDLRNFADLCFIYPTDHLTS